MFRDQIKGIFDHFSGLNILVIGDVMLDDYVKGTVTRISPEAPVPVVNIESRYKHLGGAANVAQNIKAMGANAILCSVIGHCPKSKLFLEKMEQEHLSTIGMVACQDRKLSVKYRVIGNNFQLLRMDDEQTDPLCDKHLHLLIERIKTLVENQHIDAIIFEDYDKGVVTPKLIDTVVELAQKHQILITVDPKHRNFDHYHHINIFKPNWKELCDGLQIPTDTSYQNALKQIEIFMDSHQHQIILLTLSQDGVLIVQKTAEGLITKQIPAHLRKIADVSGAGDTVIAIASLCLSLGLDIEQIASLSNLAGGLVCEHVGVVAIDYDRFFTEAVKTLQ